ncbi:MAG: DHA2 family efflux MFS transporter permease subunit [Verrucomicrobia bacterium]|nr:DHA2 family efflux MFS transporter permease subunit [Verrucomicrobiota bacterium]
MTASSSEEHVSLRTWIGVLGTLLGAFMAVLDIQITNASLREITGGIGSTAVEASWVSTSYLIGEIITIPLTAWLGRVFGTRLYLLVNVSLFLLFSGLCGTATELTQMIIYRALQGFTGGVMIPMAFTVINTQLPPSKRAVGLVLFGITATMAPAIGPYIGGLLTDSYGWSMVFYINLIPGVIMLATIFFAIDPEPMNLPLLWKGDWLGTGFMAIGLGSLIAFLEEGQNDDWFTSVFIQRCFTLAMIFIPLFIICELVSKTPVVNLRLLRIRNLGLASAVNFLLGASLYGSVFLLPEYLEQVQQYSAKQTGEAMVLIGLPQLLVFPFVPRLMKRFDLRLIVFVGALIFGGSCLLNIYMNPQFGGPQFQFANIVRALGQPFTIVPLSALATTGLMREQQGDGSALFNIMRNLGGSVGTALLSTLITQREQFHDFRIGERVTPYSPYVQQFLSSQSTQNLQHSGDPAGALQQAYRMLQQSVQLNSFVMAYSECFLVLGVILLAGSAAIWLCKRTKATGAAAAH